MASKLGKNINAAKQQLYRIQGGADIGRSGYAELLEYQQSSQQLAKGQLDAHRRDVLGQVRQVLDPSSFLEDSADKKIVEEAYAYLENPTGVLSDIQRHSESIGEVMAFMSPPYPPALDALNAQFIKIMFHYYFHRFRKSTQVKSRARTMSDLTLSIRMAIDCALTACRDNDSSLLDELNNYLRSIGRSEIRAKQKT